MSELAVSKIFDRGKTTVPSAVRKELGVGDGDRLVWIVDPDGRIYVKPSRSGARFRIVR